METFDIALGTRFEIEILDSYGNKFGKSYVSQLIDLIDKDDTVISCPIFETQYVFISTGTKIRVIFFDERFGLINFIATVKSRENKNNMLVLHIKTDTEFDRIQRRQHYRIDAVLNAEYKYPIIHKILSPEKAVNEEELISKKAITKNFSGSGMCLVSYENIPLNTIMEVTLYHNEESLMTFECKVIRCVAMASGKDKRHEVGVCYTKISLKDQNYIIRYVFNKQRELLQRNLLKK